MTELSDAWAGSARSRALAWALVGIAGLNLAVMSALNLERGGWSAVGADFAAGAPLVVPYLALGTLLALRQSANPLGWLLTAGGLTWLPGGLATGYAVVVLPGDPHDVLARLGANFDDKIWPLGVLCCIGLPLLLFPTGRPRSGRWRKMAVLMVIGCLVSLVASAVTSSPVVNPVDGSASLTNPWAIPQLRAVAAYAGGLGTLTQMLTTLAAVIGLVVGFRRASGIERQQFRWVFAGGAMAGLGILGYFVAGQLPAVPYGLVDLFGSLTFACFPVTFAVAILRYRLYDLDRIVSRTVSYAIVTGLLIAAYVGLVTGVSRLIPANGKSLAVAASTLAVATLLQPLRRRVQVVVDRRFNRSRYDSARTVEAFTVRLREQVDLGALESELLGVVHQTMQPASAWLWLRGAGANS
ncbi:MAG: hypothetical protein ABJA34_09225 [Pseudonocardiales bacterium]